MFKNKQKSTLRLKPIMEILSRKGSVIRSFITRSMESIWELLSVTELPEVWWCFLSIYKHDHNKDCGEPRMRWGPQQPPSDAAPLWFRGPCLHSWWRWPPFLIPPVILSIDPMTLGAFAFINPFTGIQWAKPSSPASFPTVILQRAAQASLSQGSRCDHRLPTQSR